MRIPIGVVAHHSRDTGPKLAALWHAELFMDDGDADTPQARQARSLATHERAWHWAAGKRQRAIILEDDVTPVADMAERAAEWFHRYPDELISFYLGTGWAHIEAASVAALDAYDHGGPDHLELDTMWGAQCYSIPTGHIEAVLADHRADLAADFSAGAAWQAQHHPGVIHTLESLVQHDGDVSAVWNPGTRQVRKARRLHVPAPRERQSTSRTAHR